MNGFKNLIIQKNKLKSDKKYIINLTTEGKDQNEGFLFRFAKDARKTDEFENLVKQLSLKAGKEKNVLSV